MGFLPEQGILMTLELSLLNNSERTNAYRNIVRCSRSTLSPCYHKIRTNPFIGFLGAKSWVYVGVMELDFDTIMQAEISLKN